jgi:hypothetical protein
MFCLLLRSVHSVLSLKYSLSFVKIYAFESFSFWTTWHKDERIPSEMNRSYLISDNLSDVPEDIYSESDDASDIEGKIKNVPRGSV